MNDTRTTMLACLQELAAAIAERGGLETTSREGEQIPYLLITNPDLTSTGGPLPGPVLNERITARRQEGGEWLFHWSWGDPLGATNDLDTAIEKIRRVLTVAEHTEA